MYHPLLRVTMSAGAADWCFVWSQRPQVPQPKKRRKGHRGGKKYRSKRTTASLDGPRPPNAFTPVVAGTPLVFGCDPHFRNVDQTPIHKNESGSKMSIAVNNSMTVPLLEPHAATSERVSVTTVTNSHEHRINHNQLLRL